jgi:hypothetical protein
VECFVICPIGEVDSETRKNSDDVFEFIIREGLSPLGYTVDRADMIAESGLITSQIIERIVSCDLVVADLTDHNANVFYELAIRHIVGKPFIHLIKAGQKIPFDVAASRTIVYSLDLVGARKASLEVRHQAQSVVDGSAKTESPISIAIDLKALTESGNPIESGLAHIQTELTKTRMLMIDNFSILHGMILGREALFAGAPGSFWSEERVELLKSMWEAGASASEIANKLGGVTRNAVIGKIHRLGLGSQRDAPEGPDPI